jgi:Protein of unknown function (DUF3551)
MKTISAIALASAIAFSTLAFSATPGAAKPAPTLPPGRYCLSYDQGGTDCSFTSYAQCETTASGIGADCYGSVFLYDEGFGNQGRYASRAAIS